MVLQPAEWILVLFPSTFISSVPSLYVNCNVLRSGFQIETIKSFDKAQSGEQDCKQFYMTNKLPDIQEEPDILKLKEKLQSISNPYYIAPYDSLQLYHYEVNYNSRSKGEGPIG